MVKRLAPGLIESNLSLQIYRIGCHRGREGLCGYIVKLVSGRDLVGLGIYPRGLLMDSAQFRESGRNSAIAYTTKLCIVT